MDLSLRVARVKTGRWSGEPIPSAMEAVRKLAEHWLDRDCRLAEPNAVQNRRRRNLDDGSRPRGARLGIPEYDPEARSGTTIILVSFSDFCGARPSNGSSARLQALRCQFKKAFECVCQAGRPQDIGS